MQNQFNNPQPPVPPRNNNYPNPMVQNQNVWNNPVQNVRPPPVNTNVNQFSPDPRSPQNINQRSPAIGNQRSPVIGNQRSPAIGNQRSPQLNPAQRSPSVNGNVRPPPPAGQMNNIRPPMTGNIRPPSVPVPPQRTNASAAPIQNPQFSANQRGPNANAQFPPQVIRNNTSASHNSNVQINTPQNIQRRSQSQKDLPEIPLKKSGSTVARSASSVKTRFVGLLNRSISRRFSTNRREKKKRLSSYGGMNVHSAYRNSLMEKPVFDSKLLLKPQNPNFIISLGIVFMIASVSLAIAIVALRNGGLTESSIHDISNEDSFGFIFFSMYMIIIGLTGYIAYHKKWTSLLITYSVFLIFGFIVQIIIICLFLKIYFNPLIQMRYKWIDILSESEKAAIQEGYNCCGYLSVVDHGITTSMCFPDTGSTTLAIKSSKAMLNTLNYLDPSVINRLSKRQDAIDGADGAGAVGGDAGNVGGDAGNVGGDAGNVGGDAGNVGGNAGNVGGNAGGNAGAAGGDAAAGGDNSTNNAEDLKALYKSRDPESYTEEDIAPGEGCASIIVSAIKSGLLQYILIEGLMAILFVVAFYLSLKHFKEQLAIEKEVDSARATFG